MRQWMRMRLVLSGIVLVLLAITFGLSSCDQSLDQVRHSGEIRIGYAIEAPYAFLDEYGEVTGESPAVARLIASRLGINSIKWYQTKFGDLIAELNSGRIDVIAAGMFITPERAELIAFSEPTFHVRPGMLVLDGNPLQIHSYVECISRTEIRIAVISGAMEENLLRFSGMSADRLISVPDALTGKVAVESHLADGLALSSVTVQWMSLRDQLGRTEAAQPFDGAIRPYTQHLGYGAFAFRKGDQQLLDTWNAALKAFIGSPEHLALISQFGFTPEEMPGFITTREVTGE